MKNNDAVPNYEEMLKDYEKKLKERDAFIKAQAEQIEWLYGHSTPWNRRRYSKLFHSGEQKKESEMITLRIPVKVTFLF